VGGLSRELFIVASAGELGVPATEDVGELTFSTRVEAED
jgi:hypothetical protein